MMRVGEGLDVHRFVQGRKLVLGGVEIPFEKGLEGWSDADALIHAIVDALLGAAALADIGTHFPPGREEWKNVESTLFLKETRALLEKEKWKIVNVDATVMAERPKLKPYMENMRRHIAEALGIDFSCVSVKAGTYEKMGFVGREEGIEAHAVALIER
jgi:2-C-methyl-D-erythritol 2,4-cyclodiphosphate synthase